MRALLLSLLMASPLMASPAAGVVSVDVDGDGKPDDVVMQPDGSVTVNAAPWGKLAGEPPWKLVGVDVVLGAERWLHVKASNAGGMSELVAVKGVVRFSGHTGADSDGERSLEIAVGPAGLTRFWRAPTMERCDGEARLFLERWTPAGFVPVALPIPDGKPLTPAADARPLARAAFHWTAASTDNTAGPERRADLLSAPRELSDGNLRTTWSGAAGDWVTARAPEGMRQVTAVRVRGAGRVVLMVGAERYRFAATVAWTVKLPAPVKADCVALVADGPARIAEAEIFTDLDGAGAGDQLVAKVVANGDEAAARLLAAEGARGVLAAATALPTSVGPGRRRLLQMVAELGGAETAPALAASLKTASSDERPVVRRALVRLGAAGERAALTVLADPTQADEARRDAATVLAVSTQAPEARDVLAKMLPEIRTAGPLQQALLAALAARVDGEWLEQIRPDAVADVALLKAAAPRAGRFPESFARAMASVWSRLPADAGAVAFGARLAWLRTAVEVALPSLAPTLTAAARSDDDVLRAVAVSALVALRQAVSSADASPRVRRAALAGLDGDARRHALASDAWPLVRRAAAGFLAGNCAEPATVGALETAVRSDHSDDVRAVALPSLARCAPGSSAILAVLADEHAAWPLRERAAALLGRPGDHVAATALAKALTAILDEQTPDDRGLFLIQACLAGIARSGDRSQASLDAVTRAVEEPTPPVRAAGVEALGRLCPKGAADVLKRAVKDADPAVQRAAAQALVTCRA